MMNKSSAVKHFSSLYTVSQKIGKGGFGQVYKGYNKNTGQPVAIKELILNPEFGTDKRRRYVERFERETLLSSRLQHPNIVRLLDKGQSNDEQLYAVFEYVDGQTLKDRLFESGPLMPVMAAEVMAQVLDALVHAHKNGIVHRDIKPANIMLTTVGAKIHVKILDFGIGTLTGEVHQQNYKSITLTQETLGTPSYSAPEQLRGEPPTPKSDLYVWGLVFIECLTGVPAVSGSSLASVFHKQLNPVNIPLPVALAGHPAAALLRRVLNKKLEERAGSALEVYQAFSKLNFSTLVGNISNPLSATTLNKDTLDQTLLNNTNFLNSGLTERKQITAMCITLNMQAVVSDDSGLDGLEDTEIIQTLHQDQKAQCVDIVLRYGALHVGTLGDTLLFYFGYPNVSENDGRLCARAALEFLGQLSKRNSLLKLSQGVFSRAHIGVHTGMVTVHTDSVPEGDTPNIAMALSRTAVANQILCTEATRKILERYIEFEAREPRAFGMRSEKVPLFAMTGERMVEAIGFLRANHRHLSFVGRKNEMNMLTGLLDPAADHRCAYVFGEVGIGKSRLIHELRNIANRHTHFVAQCLPEYKNSALYPILNLLKHKYSLNTLSCNDAVARLQTLLNEQVSIEIREAIPVLCTWLSLMIPEEPVFNVLSPDESKNILFNTLIYLLCRHDHPELCEQSLFILEDMHWADPTTIEFLSALIDSSQFKETRHVFVGTSRQAPSSSLTCHVEHSIQLEKLSEAQTAEFISLLFDQQNVSKEVTGFVINRTDGIPLFVEELISLLKQREAIHFINGTVNFANRDSIIEIPDSLRDLLQQKIDQLGEAKATIQLASAVGRKFDQSLLMECSSFGCEKILSDLKELVESDLILPLRKVDGEQYIFRHALVKDTAYESMTVRSKIKIHQRIAEHLEQSFNSEADDFNATLSRHFFLCKNFKKTKHYSNKAAKSAMEKSAYTQAVHFSEQSLNAAQELNSSAKEKLEILQTLTTATMMTVGWGSPEVEALHDRAKVLLEQLEDKDYAIKFSTYWSLATYYDVRGIHKKTHHFIQTALNLQGIESGDTAALYALKAHSLWMQGNLSEAYACANISLKNYNKEIHRNHFQVFGHDTSVLALSVLSLVLHYWGDRKESRKMALEAQQYAFELNSIHSICMAKYYQCWCSFDSCKYEEVKSISGEILELCEKEKLFNWQVVTEILLAGVNNDTQWAESILRDMISMGATQMQGYWSSIIAQTEINQNLLNVANARLNKSISQIKKSGDNVFLPKLYHLKGICAQKENDLKMSNIFFETSYNEGLKMGMFRNSNKLSVQKDCWCL